MNSRRKFLRNSSLLIALPLVGAEAKYYAGQSDAGREPYRTISLVYDDMFPSAPGIPGAPELNSIGYLHGVMRDERVDEDEKKFIVNGAEWINEESSEMFKKEYYQLSLSQRQLVLGSVMQYNWGDNWLYTLMGYLFESMFCDPIYGANRDMSGWKWLDYEPGFPRPEKLVS